MSGYIFIIEFNIIISEPQEGYFIWYKVIVVIRIFKLL